MSFKCNYLLSTGNSSIIDCRSILKDKNKKSTVVKGESFVSSDISTGHFSLSLSLNGFTLFEEYPKKSVVNGMDFFYINSGDFYMLKDEYNKNSIYLSESIQDGSEIVYDQKDIDSGSIAIQENTGVGVWENLTIPELTGQIYGSQPLDAEDFFDRWNVFFNKKKVNVEDSLEIDQMTGISFAYKKGINLTEIKTNDFDIYGTGVLPNQSELYIDGLKKERKTFIEMNTGIVMIKVGIESKKEIQEDIKTTFSL